MSCCVGALNRALLTLSTVSGEGTLNNAPCIVSTVSGDGGLIKKLIIASPNSPTVSICDHPL